MPSRDDRHLYEMLVLEGAQAGLSWATILHKREGYRRAFQGFEPAVVARFGDRGRRAAARRFRHRAEPAEGRVGGLERALRARGAGGRGEPRRVSLELRRRRADRRLVARRSPSFPAETAESRAMSKDLKRRGFRFVGPTACYSLMQSTGMAQDHVVDCFRFAELLLAEREGVGADAWRQPELEQAFVRVAAAEQRIQPVAVHLHAPHRAFRPRARRPSPWPVSTRWVSESDEVHAQPRVAPGEDLLGPDAPLTAVCVSVERERRREDVARQLPLLDRRPGVVSGEPPPAEVRLGRLRLRRRQIRDGARPSATIRRPRSVRITFSVRSYSPSPKWT